MWLPEGLENTPFTQNKRKRVEQGIPQNPANDLGF
jgi:hypothetical protein